MQGASAPMMSQSALNRVGFEPRNPKRQELEKRAATLAAPLLSDAHTPLLEGRYPHQAWDPGALWPWVEEGDAPPR